MITSQNHEELLKSMGDLSLWNMWNVDGDIISWTVQLLNKSTLWLYDCILVLLTLKFLTGLTRPTSSQLPGNLPAADWISSNWRMRWWTAIWSQRACKCSIGFEALFIYLFSTQYCVVMLINCLWIVFALVRELLIFFFLAKLVKAFIFYKYTLNAAAV